MATVIAILVTLLLGVLSLLLGLWLARRLGIDPSNLGRNMKRHREERRRLLTRGERAFLRVYTLLGFLPLAGIALVVYGRHGVRAAGIGVLILALLVMAVPISPFLRARVRRREARDGQGSLKRSGRPPT